MKAVLWGVIVAFAVLTGLAVQQHGVTGILAYQLANTAGLQVLVDLAIALALFVLWMWQDAKSKKYQSMALAGDHAFDWFVWSIILFTLSSNPTWVKQMNSVVYATSD